MRASPLITADETGARVDRGTRTPWVFQTPAASCHVVAQTTGASCHVVAQTTGAAVLAEVLGDRRPAVWGSDAAPAHLGAAAEHHQLCLAHQLRGLTDADEADGKVGARWARPPRHVRGRAIRLHRARAGLAPATFARRRTLVGNAAERLVVQDWAGQGEAGKPRRRDAKCWTDLFVFLEREGVEPTNTSSERGLRPVVRHRMMTGAYRSEAGAEPGGLFATVLTTARTTGQHRFETLGRGTGLSPLAAAHQAT